MSIDPFDARAAGANVPPVDSIDQWPILLTPNASQSARAEVPIAIVPGAGRFDILHCYTELAVILLPPGSHWFLAIARPSNTVNIPASR